MIGQTAAIHAPPVRGGLERPAVSYRLYRLGAAEATLFEELIGLLDCRFSQRWVQDDEGADVWVVSAGRLVRPEGHARLLSLGDAERGARFHVALPIHIDELEQQLEQLGAAVLAQRSQRNRPETPVTRQHKILFTGDAGFAGTDNAAAIGAVTEVPLLSTEVRNTDDSQPMAVTTAGLDYGELTLESGEKLHLYGTPSQPRFNFMWKVLARGAEGVIILVDNSQPHPLATLDLYLDGFCELIAQHACVIAVSNMESHAEPTLGTYGAHLEARGLLSPVVPADVREPSQVVQLLGLLLLQQNRHTPGKYVL